jgi:hypothetical protein
MRACPFVTFELPHEGSAHLFVSVEDDACVMRDGTGREVWRDPSSPDEGLDARAVRVRSFVKHLASYLRTLGLENISSRSDLAGKVDLELVAAAPSDAVTLAEGQPLMLKLRNRAAIDVYVSVWMLDEFLGVERIFPAMTSCLLLGPGREVTLAVSARPGPAGDQPVRMDFRVFASASPMDMSLIALPRQDRPFDVARLVEQTSPSTEAAAPTSVPRTPQADHPATPGRWTPGGPVAVTAKVWKTGMTLRMRFMGGSPALQKRVLDVASEWTKHANLRFQVVKKGDAELRVAFGDAGSWSYVGTDALSIPKEQPTINLGAVAQISNPVEFRRIVLHEFGHALGLAAAQQSPIATVPWNKKATYEYYGKRGWDRATVDHNVFAKLDRRQSTYGPPDPHSIMYHPIPKETTDGKLDILAGSELSDGDKKFIAELYPLTIVSR